MNEDLKRWDDIADEWVTSVIPKGKVSEVVTQPALKDLLGDISGKKILDAGCGNGRFSKFLSDLGGKVTGIDGSAKMIAWSRKTHPEIEFEICDLTSRLPFQNRSFDVIVSDAVLMSLADISLFLSESARILMDEGILVVSVLHPAFNHPTMRLYRTFLDKLLFRKVSGLVNDYYQGKTQRQDGNATKSLNFYHRTIAQYSNEFAKAGYTIERILEPRLTDRQYLTLHPEIEYASRLPRFIFFKLIKA